MCRARISPRPPRPLPALYGLGHNALRLLSTFRAFFTTSWPWCLFVTLPSGLGAPNFQKTKFEAWQCVWSQVNSDLNAILQFPMHIFCTCAYTSFGVLGLHTSFDRAFSKILADVKASLKSYRHLTILFSIWLKNRLS